MLSEPCLVLAPHLQYPTRNGADILVDRTSRELSKLAPYVDFISADGIRRFVDAEVEHESSVRLGPRSRVGAGLRTALFRSHYYQEKFLTRAFKGSAERYLAGHEYGMVISSYITTAAFAYGADQWNHERCHVLWTHNDEFKWFEDLRESAKSVAGRTVAKASLGTLDKLVREAPDDIVYVHVSERDRAGFERRRPDMRSIVAPIGVDLPDEPAPPLPGAGAGAGPGVGPGVEPGVEPGAGRGAGPGARGQPARFLFVGSLGVKMNLDALKNFADTFEPVLSRELSQSPRVTIAGSEPSPAVRSLCSERGWNLMPNVTDEQLRSLYETATFALLPFGYATGAKLKFLAALSHGVPVLGTEHVAVDPAWNTPPVLLSNDARRWAEHISEVLKSGISATERRRLYNIAGRYSWRASTETLVEGLVDSGCV